MAFWPFLGWGIKSNRLGSSRRGGGIDEHFLFLSSTLDALLKGGGSVINMPLIVSTSSQGCFYST